MMEDGGYLFRTGKSGVVAQVLSPAALTMQALSMWPEPTRLAGRALLAAGTRHAGRADQRLGARTSSRRTLREAQC